MFIGRFACPNAHIVILIPMWQAKLMPMPAAAPITELAFMAEQAGTSTADRQISAEQHFWWRDPVIDAATNRGCGDRQGLRFVQSG